MPDAALEPVLGRRELWKVAARWLFGILGFVVVVGIVALTQRGPLETLGKGFVARFGYVGMAFGTFIADGFHFPVPPQFYMLLAVSSGAPEGASLLAIAIGSLLGGTAAYLVGKRVARLAFVSKRLARSTLVVERMLARFGYGAALLASVSPLPYSVLSGISGAHRLPLRFFVLVSLCRLPRLCLYFWIVRASWLAT